MKNIFKLDNLGRSVILNSTLLEKINGAVAIADYLFDSDLAGDTACNEGCNYNCPRINTDGCHNPNCGC